MQMLNKLIFAAWKGIAKYYSTLNVILYNSVLSYHVSIISYQIILQAFYTNLSLYNASDFLFKNFLKWEF